MDALHRIAHWMVTPENPPRQVAGLDSERCIALHNAVLEYAWTKSGRSAEDFHSQSQVWWQYHSDDVEQFSQRLHPSLRSFLEAALILPPELDGKRQNFFYILDGLYSPGMFQHEDIEELLTLYAGQEKFASSPDGLV